MDVAQAPVVIDELAEQQRAPVAQPRDVAAELMPGVGLGDRGGAAGDQVAHQETQPIGTPQPGGVQAEFRGKPLIEHEQPQVGGWLGLPADGHLGQLAEEPVL